MDHDTQKSRGIGTMEPAILVGILALLCGFGGAAVLDRPFHGTGMFLLYTLVALPTIAVVYTVAARAFGWRRIDFDKFADWLRTIP